MNTQKIGVIIGSTRDGRFSEHAASWILELGKTNPALSLEMIDLRDHPLPFLTDAKNPSHMNGTYSLIQVQQFADRVKQYDGYIIVTPEYNRSTSGVLKNALDHIYGELAKKPVAFVAYGSVGGARAVEQLRLMAVEHQMAPIRTGVHIMAPWTLREGDGSLKAGALDAYAPAGTNMLTELTWWSNALKAGRAAI